MKLIRLSLVCLLSTVFFTSCVKKEYDNPPDTSTVDPMLPVNANLTELSLMGISMQPGTYRMLGDTTVYGIVVGDDRSGNIYKQIYIEDTSGGTGGGMVILLDKTVLYGDYPVGRKVYIKTNGLYLYNYNGLPELVYSATATTTSGIPVALINNYVIKGSYPNTITPHEFQNVADLIGSPYAYLNTLVTIDNMQFDAGSAGVIYSAPTASTNRTIIGTDSLCNLLGSITMYNSNYANFQPALTPTGKGSITGIVTIYRSTAQFVLRDTTDIHFTGTRCP